MASWLTEFASKAEKLLDSVDQATATTLQTAQVHRRQGSDSNIGSSTTDDKLDGIPGMRDSDLPSIAQSPRKPTTTSSTSSSTSNSGQSAAATSGSNATDLDHKRTDSETDLIAFLNSKAPSPNNAVTSTPIKDTNARRLSLAARTTKADDPGPTDHEAERLKKDKIFNSLHTVVGSQEGDGPLLEENKLLRNEVASLTDEVASFASRMRALQDTQTNMRTQISTLERREKQLHAANKESQQREEDVRKQLSKTEADMKALQSKLQETEKKLASLKEEKQMVLNDHTMSSEAQISAFNKLSEDNAKSARELADAHQQLEVLRAQYESQITDLQRQLDQSTKTAQSLEQQIQENKGSLAEHTTNARNAKAALESLQAEFNEYKARAARVLQTKEKIISDMRTNQSGEYSADALDLAQARREKDEYQEELVEARELIERLRQDIQDLERQQQIDAEMADSQFKELEEALAAEKQARQSAVESLTAQLREAMIARDEAVRAKQTMSTTTQELEAEVRQLKLQVSQRSAASASQMELENRLRVLTESLIQKQGQIEALNSDRTSLSLQLETERRRRDELASQVQTRSDSSTISGFEHVESGSRMKPIPSLSQDFTSNVGLSRTVNQFTQALDSFSIRLGVFLRRYPIARVMVLLYMGILHLWVMFVILTYTPEAHGHLEHLPNPPPHNPQ